MTARPRPTATDFADATFQKSSYSSGSGQCLEHAHLDATWTGIRDSKENAEAGTIPTVLVFSSGWPAFVQWVITDSPS